MSEYVTRLMTQVAAKNPGEPEFHQAVHEVAESVDLALARNPRYIDAGIFDRMVEPERVIIFRVPGSTTAARSRSIGAIASR